MHNFRRGQDVRSRRTISRLLTNTYVPAGCPGVVVDAPWLGRQVTVEFQVATLLGGWRPERVVVDVDDLVPGS